VGIQARIMVDGDIVAVHTSRLSAQNDQVPGGDRAGVVHGNTSEHATAAFMKRLGKGAGAVAEHVDIVRVAVKENAKALQKAVDDFDEHEQHSVAWVRDRRELISDTAKNTTKADVERGHDALKKEQEQSTSKATVRNGDGDSGPAVSSAGRL